MVHIHISTRSTQFPTMDENLHDTGGSASRSARSDGFLTTPFQSRHVRRIGRRDPRTNIASSSEQVAKNTPAKVQNLVRTPSAEVQNPVRTPPTKVEVPTQPLPSDPQNESTAAREGKKPKLSIVDILEES